MREINRPLRFRAWDSSRDLMLAPQDLSQNGKCWDWLGKLDLPLMQYTGLKDATEWKDLTQYEQQLFRISLGLTDGSEAEKKWCGKEIYEEDILDCIYKFDGCKKHKLQVYYDIESARFWLKNIGKCLQPRVTKTMWDMTRSKIIGNRFENPKLIKEE